MSHLQPDPNPEPCSPEKQILDESVRPVAELSAPADQGQPAPAAKPLTAEEQMALYEEELKENDWGHQPC
jgi:hypothetical protein